ncbi:MAG: DUF924 family protein [Marinicellaceae bacterium]
MNYQEIIQFWFHDIEPKQIWIKDAKFDQLITDKFSKVYQQATRCELYDWRQSAEGCLAEIIVLDQFSRNMFRDSSLAFKYDALALCLAQSAVFQGIDKKIDKDKRGFIYLPYMHSESKIIHQQALKIYQDHGVEGSLEFEIKHKNIIDRFGRYPHRNKVLGRKSTNEEIEFLKGPNSSF